MLWIGDKVNELEDTVRRLNAKLESKSFADDCMESLVKTRLDQLERRCAKQQEIIKALLNYMNVETKPVNPVAQPTLIIQPKAQPKKET